MDLKSVIQAIAWVDYYRASEYQTTVGIQLSALQLPETSSYRTFTSSLTEWLMTIQLPDFLSGNWMVAWILDKKSGNWMV